MIRDPSVMASAPGGTGPPTHTRAPRTRTGGVPWSKRPTDAASSPGAVGTSEQAGGQDFAVLDRSRVVGPHRLEQIQELLPRFLIRLDAVEQRIQPRLQLVVAGHDGGIGPESGHGRHPTDF